MKKLMMILLLGSRAFAEDSPPRIVELKYMDPGSLQNLFGPFDVRVNRVPGSRIVVLNGSKEHVAAAEETLKRFDVPKKNIELTFQVLDASAQPNNEKVPSDLEAVVKQLKSTFVYQSFRLLDTLQIRTQEGIRGDVSGVMPREQANAPLRFLSVGFQSTMIATEARGSTIHLDQLFFQSRLPNGSNGKGGVDYVQAGIQTSIDIPEGKKVVVGKANMDGKEGAYFLIVTAKVVD
jgi:hypothetical protein